MDPKIVVVGSCVTDLICYTDNFPTYGDTIDGKQFQMGFGGKGANQCIAASKLGAPTAMVACVGNDTFGWDYIKNFKTSKVNSQYVHTVEDESTGTATIIVDGKGQNTIVLVRGANEKMTAERVHQAEHLIKGAQVVVCQWEITPEATMETLRLARKHKVKTLVNVAPVPTDIDPEVFPLCDMVCVNEQEALVLTGKQVNSVSDAEEACKDLLKRGCGEAIVTMGAAGVVYANATSVEHIPAPHVESVVDTTGAGDAFVGALSYFLVSRPDLSRSDMVRKASQVASLSVQAKGTQSSYPSKEDVHEILHM